MRRLTRAEYNSTVQVIMQNDTNPANALPPELLGNGFGNDADHQPVSAFLIEQYAGVAEEVAATAIAAPGYVAGYAPCYSTITAETEEACARTFIEGFGRDAYRRPLEATEVDELLALERQIRTTDTFESSLGAVVEAVLQGPDFLYRLEFGVADTANPAVLRPTSYEMATRLSYLFWGGPPDEALYTAATTGELLTNAGVLAQATRLLQDLEKVRPMVRNFFNYYLPLNTLTDLSRDVEQYPTFSASIGALMREETQLFMENEIFGGSGTWPGALTAPYTYANEELANFYGIPGVTGPEFRQVMLPDTSKRLGLLTQGAIQAGTAVSNYTNPVRRGVFLLREILCADLEDPPADIAESIMPPEPTSGATGRERYSAHSTIALCASCHATMDPPGFALENFDAVGLWRDTEGGVTIDASGELPSLLPAPFNGPIELVQQIAASPQAQNCFAEKWMTFGYGREIDTLTDTADACNAVSIQESFAASGYNIQQLLLSLTQTEAFLYLSPEQL
jgi:hypothetical protein